MTSQPRRRRRLVAVAAGAAVVALVAVAVVPRLLGGQGGPPVASTPNDNAGVNGVPGFEVMLSAGGGALLGNRAAYWCTPSSCGGGPSLAAWTSGPFTSVAGGALPDGTPVLAGLTEVHGDTLRLSLLRCTRRACTTVGGGTFAAPGFRPGAGINPVYAASANGAGFAVAFGDYHAAGTESLYVVVCDSAACGHPRAIGLATGGSTTGPPVGGVAVAAAPHGGFVAALADRRTAYIDVYRCAAQCRSATERQVPVHPAGAVAITATSSGQTLLAYDAGLFTGYSDSEVVLAGAAPGGSFSSLAAVKAPISGAGTGGSGTGPGPYPAIAFSGPKLLVVSEDSSGHSVTLTTCVTASCGGTIKVTTVAPAGNPVAALGIGIPGSTQPVFWATRDTDVLGGIHYSGHLWIGHRSRA
jgi:hypothetical protein